jgi:hypothetical protein
VRSPNSFSVASTALAMIDWYHSLSHDFVQ